MSEIRPPGHPPHQPTDVTRGQVEALAGFGVCHEDIGLVIGIDDKTLRKWYRHELDTGKAKANAKMAQNIFQKALGTGPQAATLAIFWAKTQMRWKEPPERFEHSGREGGPIETRAVTDLDRARALAVFLARTKACLSGPSGSG